MNKKEEYNIEINLSIEEEHINAVCFSVSGPNMTSIVFSQYYAKDELVQFIVGEIQKLKKGISLRVCIDIEPNVSMDKTWLQKEIAKRIL